MKLRRNKSKKAQAVDALGTYLKLKTAGKAAKGATKAAKGTAAYAAVKNTPSIKRVPLIVGGAAAATFVALKLRRGGDEQTAAT